MFDNVSIDQQQYPQNWICRHIYYNRICSDLLKWHKTVVTYHRSLTVCVPDASVSVIWPCRQQLTVTLPSKTHRVKVHALQLIRQTLHPSVNSVSGFPKIEPKHHNYKPKSQIVLLISMVDIMIPGW